MRRDLGSLRLVRSAFVNFLPRNRKTRTTSAAAAILGLTVLLAMVLIIGSGEARATGSDAPEAGFDMVSDGSNTGTTLGTIETCVHVPATVGATFTIDTFLDAIPTGEDLDGWNYALEFPDTVVKLITTDYSVSMTPTTAGFVDLGEGAGAPGPGTGDDVISPQLVAIANLGQATSTPAGTAGVLGRYTFQVTAATAGTHSFSFEPGLTVFASSTLNDWTGSISFATYGVGTLALGVTCAGGFVHGDVDCSGAVTASDALKVLRHIVGLPVVQKEPCDDIGTGGPPVQGDVDCSDAVTASDALKVLRYIVGLPNTLPPGCPDIGT